MRSEFEKALLKEYERLNRDDSRIAALKRVIEVYNIIDKKEFAITEARKIAPTFSPVDMHRYIFDRGPPISDHEARLREAAQVYIRIMES